MTTTQPTKPPPSRDDLERLRRDLADHCCAAEESGNDKLAADLNGALDVIETAIATAAPAGAGFH
jgi:hypothetical protein